MNMENYEKNTTELEKYSMKKSAILILDFLNTPNGIYDQIKPEKVANNQSWLNYILVSKKILIQATPEEYMECLRILAAYKRTA